MNILWITNMVFPEAKSLLLGLSSSQKGGGGWMLASAEALLAKGNIKLFIATVSKDVHKLTRVDGEKIVYYLIPYGKGNTKFNPDYNQYWDEINNIIKPNIVHIHGTEFTHGLSFVKTCGADNVVVSIQGLKSAYSYYYYYGISIKDIILNSTLRSLYDGGILSEYRKFKKTGRYEIKLLQSVNHIIGRTSWDRARTWAINPHAEYHFCNEILRKEFYEGKWEYDKCDKHSVFISQAHYPIKGLHMILKALSLVRNFYPDVELRIAGGNITRSSSFMDRIKLSNYGRLIRRIISENHLDDCVKFLGAQNAFEMKNQYLRSNVFVCPSSIENSPNSLGEAQLLGVPCISSFVGGTMDMIPSPQCGELYRFEEYEMLAYKICDIFEKSESFDSSMMRKIAFARHDRIHNTDVLFRIYSSVKK